MKHRSSIRQYAALELLDYAFRIYRSTFWRCVTYVALIMVPLTILNIILIVPPTRLITTLMFVVDDVRVMPVVISEQIIGALAQIIGVSALVSLVQTILITGPLTYMVSEHINGNPITLVAAFRATVRRLAPLGIALVIVYVLLGVLGIGMFFAVISTCGIGLFIAIPIVIFIAMPLLAFIAPIIVLENQSGMNALRRAWTLGKSRFWRILGSYALVIILQQIANTVLNLIFQSIASAPSTSATLTPVDALNIMLELAIAILIAPILPVVFTLLYYDTRVRDERMDLALMALASDGNNRAGRPGDIQPPLTESAMLTTMDVRTIMQLTMLFSALMFLLYTLIALTAGTSLP